VILAITTGSGLSTIPLQGALKTAELAEKQYSIGCNVLLMAKKYIYCSYNGSKAPSTWWGFFCVWEL